MSGTGELIFSAAGLTCPLSREHAIVALVGMWLIEWDRCGSCGPFARSSRAPAQQPISRRCLAGYALPDAGVPKHPPTKVADRGSCYLRTVTAVGVSLVRRITGTQNS